METRNTRTVEDSFDTEDFEREEFTIAVNKKSFDILLDKMYTNKPRSIIRELWTNAYDAHVVAGVADQPFHCQLPTVLDPAFSVRDYGCAMEHAEVMTLYRTVFASSKTATNDQVGCLGLGSKSPFAYTDAFFVTVWINGEKRVYLAAIGANGIPTITLVLTEESGEPQGLEVSFPVQAQDFRTFREEAEYVAAGFDVKPTVPGLELRVAVPLFEGSNWRVLNDHPNAIRQGCVVYPVSKQDIDVATNLGYGKGLVVDVPIGHVDVAANREALSLDPLTRSNVEAAFGEAIRELHEEVQEFIQAAPDAFEANVRYLKMSELMDLSAVEYNGQKLTGTISFRRQDKATVDVVLEQHLKPVVGRLDYHVNTASDHTFLIDRPDVVIPRKRSRFHAWRNAKPTWERNRIQILRNPTSKQLAALVRRLHLEPSQLVSWQSLPDVKIDRMPRNLDRFLGGVYEFTNKMAQPKALADTYFWLEIPLVNGRDWPLTGLGQYSTFSRESAKYVLETLVNAMGVTIPVYVMTPGAVKRFKPKGTDNFITAAHTWGTANAKTVLADFSVEVAAAALHAHAFVEDSVVDKLLVHLHPNATKVEVRDALRIIERTHAKETTAARAKGTEIATKIRKKYPLIFDAEAADQLKYIELVNAG